MTLPPGSYVPGLIGDREIVLWLTETCVRIGAEIEVLCAALRRARMAEDVEDHWFLMLECQNRLDGLDRSVRLLASPLTRSTELATDARYLCDALMCGRPTDFLRRRLFDFDMEEMRTDGLTARRVLLILAQIVLARRVSESMIAGLTPLRVGLCASRGRVALTVRSDGVAPTDLTAEELIVDLSLAGGGRARRWGETYRVRVELPATNLDVWPF